MWSGELGDLNQFLDSYELEIILPNETSTTLAYKSICTSLIHGLLHHTILSQLRATTHISRC
jgi:hypothetical protein